nr:uncharacterized protein LOC125423053 [Ziziphus jujuba var. spinosa]
MACTTAKEVWDKLKEEFQGSAKTRQMQVLNLRREFETLRMKDSELVKDFIDRLMKVVNQIKILGEELSDRKVVEKVLVSLPEKFESKISSLEESNDLNQISLSELVNALQVTEQRSIRQEEASKSAFLALQKGKSPANNNQRKQQGGGSNDKGRDGVSANREGERKKFVMCSHCKKDNHSKKYCCFTPNVQCRACKQLGHVEKVCKNKGKPIQQAHQVQVADEAWQSEERLFVATCYAENGRKEAWLVDSGCT